MTYQLINADPFHTMSMLLPAASFPEHYNVKHVHALFPLHGQKLVEFPLGFAIELILIVVDISDESCDTETLDAASSFHAEGEHGRNLLSPHHNA